MSSRELRPSESVVWQCRSPLRSSSVTSFGSSPRDRRLQLAAALAQLRFDVGEAEHLVDPLLGRAAVTSCRSRPPRRRTRSRACRGAPRTRAARRCAASSPSGAGGRCRTGPARRRGSRSGARCASSLARPPRRPTPASLSSSISVNARVSAAGSCAVAMMSRSLHVSVIRRALPAISTRSAAGCVRR